MTLASGARIFISHSAKEAHALTALFALESALTEARFDVLLDKTRLEVGGTWRMELQNWMCQCHGAVILFSRSALASDWVLQEATILNWRRMNDRQFVLIPVFLDDAESALAQTKFGALGLSEVQGIARLGHEEMIERLIARLGPLREQYRQKTPQEQLEQLLAQIMQREGVEKVQDQFYTAFNGVVLPWSPGNDRYVALARCMLQAGFETAMRGLRRVAPYLSRDARRQMLELLAPMCVDLRPALRIQEISSSREGQRTIGVNGSRDFTAKMYVRRASFGELNWKLITTVSSIGEDPAGSLIEELWVSLRRELATEDYSDHETSEALEQEVEAGYRFFVVFSPPAPDNTVLNKLREVFPQLVFFVLSGREHQSVADANASGIEFLEPLLDPHWERNVHRTYSMASQELEQIA